MRSDENCRRSYPETQCGWTDRNRRLYHDTQPLSCGVVYKCGTSEALAVMVYLPSLTRSNACACAPTGHLTLKPTLDSRNFFMTRIKFCGPEVPTVMKFCWTVRPLYTNNRYNQKRLYSLFTTTSL